MPVFRVFHPAAFVAALALLSAWPSAGRAGEGALGVSVALEKEVYRLGDTQVVRVATSGEGVVDVYAQLRFPDIETKYYLYEDGSYGTVEGPLLSGWSVENVEDYPLFQWTFPTTVATSTELPAGMYDWSLAFKNAGGEELLAESTVIWEYRYNEPIVMGSLGVTIDNAGPPVTEETPHKDIVGAAEVDVIADLTLTDAIAGLGTSYDIYVARFDPDGTVYTLSRLGVLGPAGTVEPLRRIPSEEPLIWNRTTLYTQTFDETTPAGTYTWVLAVLEGEYDPSRRDTDVLFRSATVTFAHAPGGGGDGGESDGGDGDGDEDGADDGGTIVDFLSGGGDAPLVDRAAEGAGDIVEALSTPAE